MLFYAKYLIRLLARPRKNSYGFTLIELLVTALISGVLVSGLLYLTNELLTSDQRESTKTETQRDLNFALDFISAELKDATYVYTNAACLVDNGGAGCTDDDGVKLINSNQVELPNDSGTPVLAFWKQEPLEDALVQKCINNTADERVVPCIKGNAYSLVVYSLKEQNDDDLGKAAIFRYSMKMTEDSLDDDEYFTPIEAQSFRYKDWPHENGPAKFSDPELLVDFVDDDNGQALTCPTADYQVTPRTGGLDSFYACVKDVVINTGPSTTTNTVLGVGNQDVVIRLRGNAKNRSALMGDESFLPTLETQTLVRGVLQRQL